MNEKQRTVLLCVMADMVGAWQDWQQNIYHDWEAHVQSINDMVAAFPDIDFEIPEELKPPKEME